MLDTLATTGTKQPPIKSKLVTMRRARWRMMVRCAFMAGFVMFAAECLRIFVGGNFHSVVPGKCYRSGQPSADFLETVQRTHGIKAILNLRGGDENTGEPWYDEEKEAAERLGIKMIDAGLSGMEQAPREDFVKFFKALDESPEPLLIHCANGNDRTGLASAYFLLTRTDTSLPEARRQLSLRYGHFSWGKAGCLQRLLDSYEAWLAGKGWEHSADHLRDWACNVYRPEALPHRVTAADQAK